MDENPGTRLLALLDEARATNNPAHINALQRWAEIWGVEQADTVGIMQCAAVTANLAIETRRLIESCEDTDDVEGLLRHFGQVEATVGNFRGMQHITMTQFLQALQDTGMYSLEMCSRLLARRRPQPSVPDLERTSLLSTIAELLTQVESATDLDPEMRMFVIDRLTEVQRALLVSKVFGHKDFERAAYDFAFSIRTPDRSTRISRSKIGKAIMEASVAVVTVAASITQTYESIESTPPPATVVQVITQIDQRHINGQPVLPANDTPRELEGPEQPSN